MNKEQLEKLKDETANIRIEIDNIKRHFLDDIEDSLEQIEAIIQEAEE